MTRAPASASASRAAGRPSSTGPTDSCGSSGCGPAARAGSTGCRPCAALRLRQGQRVRVVAALVAGLVLLLAWLLAGRAAPAGSCAHEAHPARRRAGARWSRSRTRSCGRSSRPPFHVPDETVHVAYVQYLAETGRIPNKPGATRLLGRGGRRCSTRSGSTRVVGKRARPAVARRRTTARDRRQRGRPQPRERRRHRRELEPAAALLRVRVARLPRLARGTACSSGSG